MLDDDVDETEFPEARTAPDDVPRPNPDVVFDLLQREEMHERWCRLSDEEQYRRMDEQGESIWHRASQEARDVLDWLGALLVRHHVITPMSDSVGSRQMNLRAWGESTGNLDLASVGVALDRGWSDERIVAVIRSRMSPKEVRAMTEKDAAGLEVLIALKGPLRDPWQ